MQSENRAAGRYYERFQVLDTIHFFNRKLILAKEPNGRQVFLQEIEMNHFVPPGIREVLRNFDHPHVAPIQDVIEEHRRIILVHPPMIGEPLSMLVDPDHPMPPIQALRIFRRLLRTMVDLYNLPLPMTTTLDPRNVIMNENHPYVLFLNFKCHRLDFMKSGELLYFADGKEPEGDVRRSIEDHQDIPPGEAADRRLLRSANTIQCIGAPESTAFSCRRRKTLEEVAVSGGGGGSGGVRRPHGIQLTSNTAMSEPLNLEAEPAGWPPFLSSGWMISQVYSLGLPEEPVGSGRADPSG